MTPKNPEVLDALSVVSATYGEAAPNDSLKGLGARFVVRVATAIWTATKDTGAISAAPGATRKNIARTPTISVQ